MTRLARSKPEAVEVHVGDLPDGVSFSGMVAVDTETQGLNPQRDRLCVVQLSAGDGVCHLVHFPEPSYEAPNLRALFEDRSLTKIFHYARFDVVILRRYLNVGITPVYCTKIASKLSRTYTDKHGLKDVSKEMLGVDLSKAQQSSDWAAATLSREQIAYAAADVLNLHAIQERLDAMLQREGRADLAAACFAFLATRGDLDLQGWADVDIFAH